MAAEPNTRSMITRRHLFVLAGAGGIGAALAACADTADTGAPSDGSAGAGDDLVSPDCVLTPESIEGPFYADLDLVRRDITDGRAGEPLRMQLRVVDAQACSPLQDASVDVWHADATGQYSAFPSQGDAGDIDTSGQGFLRGVQSTGADGVATFDTIYPGWYPGRTTHIHVKVHLTDRTRVTTQLYFPDDVTNEVYAGSSYVERGQKDTTNAADAFGADDQNLLMRVEREGDLLVATGTLGIAAA